MTVYKAHYSVADLNSCIEASHSSRKHNLVASSDVLDVSLYHSSALNSATIHLDTLVFRFSCNRGAPQNSLHVHSVFKHRGASHTFCEPSQNTVHFRVRPALLHSGDSKGAPEWAMAPRFLLAPPLCFLISRLSSFG